MLCYRDRSYCGSEVEEHTCGCEITEEELKHTEELGLPVSYINYCEESK